jgi:hypothetical protein
MQPRHKTYKFDLPNIDGGYDLIRHIESLGFNRSSVNGFTGIQYSEINQWMHSMGLNLSAWEVETLFQLSSIHAEMSMKATDIDCPAPCKIESDEDRRKRITDEIFK